MVSIIVAAARNGVIGKDNRLLWRLPADLKRFRTLTMGHHIVMGRKTFESIGKALPGRTNVIVTRQPGYDRRNCLVAHSLEDALALCEGDPEIFVIGGGELYRQALPLTDRVYLTRVHADLEGDVTFPDLPPEEWETSEEERHGADEKNPYAYSFITLNRKGSSTG